jgi:hypothetical protein
MTADWKREMRARRLSGADVFDQVSKLLDGDDE